MTICLECSGKGVYGKAVCGECHGRGRSVCGENENTDMAAADEWDEWDSLYAEMGGEA